MKDSCGIEYVVLKCTISSSRDASAAVENSHDIEDKDKEEDEVEAAAAVAAGGGIADLGFGTTCPPVTAAVTVCPRR